jgi:hypothetical protein
LIRPLVPEIENARKADKSILFQIVLALNMCKAQEGAGKGQNFA